jgi:hypothetical protein
MQGTLTVNAGRILNAEKQGDTQASFSCCVFSGDLSTSSFDILLPEVAVSSISMELIPIKIVYLSILLLLKMGNTARESFGLWHVPSDDSVCTLCGYKCNQEPPQISLL